ncbi:MAG: hypothetical protein AAFR04_01700 [Pseudomonadota bacterium]
MKNRSGAWRAGAPLETPQRVKGFAAPAPHHEVCEAQRGTGNDQVVPWRPYVVEAKGGVKPTLQVTPQQLKMLL